MCARFLEDCNCLKVRKTNQSESIYRKNDIIDPETAIQVGHAAGRDAGNVDEASIDCG